MYVHAYVHINLTALLRIDALSDGGLAAWAALARRRDYVDMLKPNALRYV